MTPAKKVAGTVVTSAPGSTRFEQARRRLAKDTAREVEQVSDADVIAYLSGREVDPRSRQ